MSKSLARTLAVLGLLMVPTFYVVRARGADHVEAVPAELPGAAFVEAPRAGPAGPVEPVRPAKPRRQIVDHVEVVVNIPSGRLELIQGDSVVRSYPVSVGSRRYATPPGDYLLATVIFNPWWNPPPGSAWAAKRKRTPPGPGNPMGRVKLHMDELIYIHGTTSEGRLGAPASHGCIRMRNSDAIDLARRLHTIANPSVGEAELDRMSRMDSRERHTVLARSVRMRVLYKVARVRGEKLHVYPDVYGRTPDLASAVRSELDRAGHGSVKVDEVALRYLRTRASGGGAAFEVDRLPTLRPPAPKVEMAPAPQSFAPAATDSAPAPVAEPAPEPAEPDTTAPAQP